MAGPVQTAADDAQRQILAIGAQQGDAGVKAFNDALASVDQINADALARANLQTSQVNAPVGAGAEMAALYNRPAATAAGLINAAKASFQGDIARSSYDNVAYNQKLGAVEPMLDKYLAAKAAAEAAGSGGGGSGGGGSGGGGSDLSDSELRVQLKGAADSARQTDIATAAAQLAQASKARVAARQNVNMRRLRLRGSQKRLTRGAARATRHGKKIGGGKLTKGQKATILADRDRVLADTMNVLRRTGRVVKANAKSVKAQQAQRGAYAGLVTTANSPLEEYARAIGVEAGEDPNRVYGLIGPTEAKSFRLADEDRNKKAGGTLAMFGRQPSLGPLAAAKELNLAPKNVRALRKSADYRTLAASVEQAIASGTPIAEVARGLASWRQPQQENVYNKKRVKQKGGTYAPGTLVVGKRMGRGHGHLVDLVLSDYAPAFQK